MDTGAGWPCFTAAAEADQRRVAFRTDTNTHAPRGRMPSATRGRRAWCGRTRDATPTRHARPIEAVETDILSKRAHRSDVVGSLRFYYPVQYVFSTRPFRISDLDRSAPTRRS